jgi:hypothetical protein
MTSGILYIAGIPMPPNWFVFPLSRIRIMGRQGVGLSSGRHKENMSGNSSWRRDSPRRSRKSAAVRWYDCGAGAFRGRPSSFHPSSSPGYIRPGGCRRPGRGTDSACSQLPLSDLDESRHRGAPGVREVVEADVLLEHLEVDDGVDAFKNHQASCAAA